MTAPASLPRAPRAVTIFAIAALVAGPPLEYLRYNHYPLFKPELLLPITLWVLCAVGCGGLLNRAPRAARIAAFSLFLLIFIDWQFSDHVDLPFKLLLVMIVPIVWLLEAHVETIVALALVTFYLSSVPTGNPMRASTLDYPMVARDTSLPPVLYLILDEHVGIEGWPAEIPSARAMQRQVRQFYLDEGFRLFGRAYSEFSETHASIPAALNWPVEEPHRDVAQVVREQRYLLKRNELFGKVSAEGYRIRVYQSTYLDFCDGHGYAIRSCETRPANSIQNISLHHMPLWAKTRLVGLYFLEHNSHLYVHLRELYSGFARRHSTWPPWDVRIEKAGFPAAIELLGRLREDLRTDDPRGTLYFAHLLAPHHPYEVGATCEAQHHPSRWLEIIPYPDRGVNTPAERLQRYDLYAAQMGCLYLHLQTLLRLVDSLPNGRQVVVMIHGDHGSRITLHYPLVRLLPNMQPSDFADAFSALFAIRAPGIPPGYDRRLAPINELVGRALASGFKRIDVPAIERHVVKFDMGFGARFHTIDLQDTALALPDGSGTAAVPHLQ